MVLGKRLQPNGQPTIHLQSRIRKSARVHSQICNQIRKETEGYRGKEAETDEDNKSDVCIIVTGGQTVPGYLESPVMKKMLIEQVFYSLFPVIFLEI